MPHLRRSLAAWYFAALAAALLFALPARAAVRAPGPEVHFQGVVVTLQPDQHALTGESNLIYAPGARRVTLRLAESAQVRYVQVAEHRAAFSFDGGVLSFDLPATAEPVPVTVAYSATFEDRVAGGPAAGEDPSYGVSGAITPEGTFLGDGAFWYPVPPQVPARRAVKVSAPAYTEAITYGRRVSRETSGAVTRSVWEEARPVGALTLCAGPYRIEEKTTASGIPVYSYLYPQNSALSSRYLDAAANYLTFYSTLFGPYPFEKFAVVENYFPTGYGFPSFTLLGGTVIRLPFIVDTSLPHEIAHSWWGNGIGVDPRQGNWCEGLVSYLADYYLKERRSAAEGREYRRQLLIDYASLVTPGNDFPLDQFTSRVDPASRAIGYGKAAMVFHMIRTRIGDAAFFEALREVAREHMYGSASWSDLIRAFSRSSGSDVAPFVSQWLTRTGGPRLALSEVTESRGGGGWTITGSIVQTPPLFDLVVPLRLDTAGAPVQVSVRSNSERTPFSLSSSVKPQRVALDPDADVFRVLSREEVPVTVNSLKGSTSLVGVMTADCRCDSETFRNLLASLSQGSAPVVPEKELTEKEASGHDLIFCGRPGRSALFPALPDGVAIAAGSFSVAGEKYQAPDALLLLVTKQRSTGRIAALFEPLSQAAATQYYPKLTHYGKYGYLIFAGGANRVKGTMASGDGAVAVTLPK